MHATLLCGYTGHDSIAKLLLERDDLEADTQHHFRRTPLSYVAKKGSKDIANLLIKRDGVEADL